MDEHHGKIPIYVLDELNEVLDEMTKGGVPYNKITIDRHKSKYMRENETLNLQFDIWQVHKNRKLMEANMKSCNNHWLV